MLQTLSKDTDEKTRPRLGAHVTEDGTRFSAYVTTARSCAVRLYDDHGGALATHELARGEDGVFEALLPGVRAGARYQLVLDGRELPDPYARFLPDGVHGPAMVVAAGHRFRNRGVSRPLREHVFYELHVGTFSPEGTYAGVRQRLADLAALGVTAIELMPLAAFAGGRGWGYDGVALYAPHAAYGPPDDLRLLIDDAHGLGLAVFLDVVYNHLGPAGNYLAAYSDRYFTHDFKNAWGDAPDYRHPQMRRYAIDNALYWLTEFGFDGLRLDATHAIWDPSPRHVLRELADEVAKLEPARLLIAEDERNDPTLVTAQGLDGIWADDFHHQVRVTLTGERDGYYAAYEPGVAGVAHVIERGWLYEGQVYPPSGHARGARADALPAEAFVTCIQNHDQIGNRAFGERLNHQISAQAFRAVSALLLFLPTTPLLFQGQEWAASSPFQFFTDHDEELGRLVSEGRREEFKKFASFSDPAVRARIPDPQAAETFERSKLRWEERAEGEHARTLAAYQALLSLRARDPVLADPKSADRASLQADARGDLLVVTRKAAAGTRTLIVNFGKAPQPFAQACARHAEQVLFRSEPADPEVAIVRPHEAVILG